jgi:hypothetical protein
MRFNSIGQGFGNNFVDDITESNRSEILREDRVRFFWDKSNESLV